MTASEIPRRRGIGEVRLDVRVPVCVISDCEKSGLKVRHAVLERVCHDSEFDTVTDQLKEMIVAESLQ